MQLARRGRGSDDVGCRRPDVRLALQRADALRRAAAMSQGHSDRCWSIGKLKSAKAFQAVAEREFADAELAYRYAAELADAPLERAG
jgi:hypothetical protein